MRQAGDQGVLMREVAAEPKTDDARIFGAKLFDHLPAVIDAAVVDENDFPRFGPLSHGEPNAPDELRQVFRLVVASRYDRHDWRNGDALFLHGALPFGRCGSRSK